MTDLYGRSWTITASDGVTTKTFKNLRVSFSATKTSDITPNEMSLSIYNLNDTSRAFLNKRGIELVFEAGYTDLTGTIFRGFIEPPLSLEKERTDWKSTLKAKDGIAALRNVFLTETFAANTPIEQVITKVVDKLTVLPDDVQKIKSLKALAKGKIQAIPTKLPPIQKPQTKQATPTQLSKEARKKIAERKRAAAKAERQQRQQAQAQLRADAKTKKALILRGLAVESLDYLCRSYNLRWYVTDNTLHVVPVGEPIRVIEVVIAKDSGLIGSPEVTAEGRIKVKSLLRPDLNPGMEIKVQAKGIDGSYLIKRVEHTGDSRAQEWYTELELANG